MKHYLIRMRLELFERVKFFSKEEKISINKMLIKLIEIGIITYIKGGVGLYENNSK